MKTATALGVVFGVVLLATVGLLVQTWLLGIILPWFGVSLTFWQNFAIIVLANMITYSSGGSSK
jgi:hypothetical protein